MSGRGNLAGRGRHLKVAWRLSRTRKQRAAGLGGRVDESRKQMANHSNYETDGYERRIEPVVLRAQVESVIRQGLSDMWLLLDGEEIVEDGLADLNWRDGRAFAMVSDDQVCLLGSKVFALTALRSVGITL
jgi:hypothetical protein